MTAARDTRPFLVLGPTGGFGGAMLDALRGSGRQVRAFARDTKTARGRLGAPTDVEWIAGDVQDREAVARAALGVQAIVHGVNYPYPQWRPAMITATDNVIAAARAAQAAVLFPANCYVFAAGLAGFPIAEDAPRQPETRKGRLRVELEDRLATAAADGLRVLAVRTGDYYGGGARNGLLDLLFGRAKMRRPMVSLGRRDAPHQWAYLPDLARAVIALYDHQGLQTGYHCVHFAGHSLPRADAFPAAIAAAVGGRPDTRWLPWWVLRLRGLVDPVIGELIELRHLWYAPPILDDGQFRGLVPDFAGTPLDEAVARTLKDYSAA